MHRGCVDVLDKVLVASLRTSRAHAAAVLCTEFGKGGTLDISQVRDSDNHIVVGLEVFFVELAGGILDLSAACVAIFLADFAELALDEFAEYVSRRGG